MLLKQERKVVTTTETDGIYTKLYTEVNLYSVLFPVAVLLLKYNIQYIQCIYCNDLYAIVKKKCHLILARGHIRPSFVCLCWLNK